MVDNNNLGAGGCSHEEGGGIIIKEQDRLLPIANVGRIMKQILPPNAKISKEAKETMQECVSEFISFVTSEASEKCRRERRKTVNGDDICWALGTLGFDDYSGPLKRYLNRHREMEGERSNNNNNQDGVGGVLISNSTAINEEMEDPYSSTSLRTNHPQQQQPRNQAAEDSSTSVLRFMSNTSSNTSRPPY